MGTRLGIGIGPAPYPLNASRTLPWGRPMDSFPKAPVGATAPVTFTIANSNTASNGGINLESGAVTCDHRRRPTLADFAMVSTTCGPSLQPGQTCIYIVSFKPTTPGLRTATISVSTANGGNVGTNIEGIGLAPIEIQPCGYAESTSAGIPPTDATLAAGDATASDAAKLNCIKKLATSSASTQRIALASISARYPWARTATR